MSQQIIYKAE